MIPECPSVEIVLGWHSDQIIPTRLIPPQLKHMCARIGLKLGSKSRWNYTLVYCGEFRGNTVRAGAAEC
jgi:hypothetical protein